MKVCQADPSVLTLVCAAGGRHLPPVAPLAPQDGQAGREDHQEDHHDGQEDEGAGHQGDLLQVVTFQCTGHGR